MRRALLIAVVLAWAVSAQAQVTRIQGVTINGTSGTGTVSVTLGTNVTIGSRVLVVTRINSNETITAGMLTNSGTAETWALDCVIEVATDSIGFFSTTITAAQSLVLTFDPAATGRLTVAATEFSGVGAYGSVCPTIATGTGTTITSNSFTPGAATGVAMAVVGSSQTVTYEADYATNAAQNTTGRSAVGYDIDPAASSQAVDATQTSSGWSVAVAWYAASGAASTCGRGVSLLGAGKCE